MRTTNSMARRGQSTRLMGAARRGWLTAALGVILVALALGTRVAWSGVLAFGLGLGLTAWGIALVAQDERPVLRRPNPRFPSLRLLVPMLAVSLSLAAVLGWFTFDMATTEAAWSAIGMTIAATGLLAREILGCPAWLARFAPAVVFVRLTVNGLGRQNPSAALLGGFLTVGVTFGFTAWRAWHRTHAEGAGSPVVREG